MYIRLCGLTVLSITVLPFVFACAATDGQQGGIFVETVGASLPVIPDGVVGRAITWENKTGQPGAGGKAKGGRKGSPCIKNVKPGQTVTLMDIAGCGVIRHIWVTPSDRSPVALRNLIIRMYWDGSEVPSVEVPFGDFFGSAHGRAVHVVSHYTTMTMGKGFNCFFPMPFATRARITVQNDMPPDYRPLKMLFFQIDFELRKSLPSNIGRFHAQFRRQNPTVEKQDYVILDNVEGPGFFAGCVIGARMLKPYWWGEGEMKFYMDGDSDYPTICGTGTEDYFCSAWCGARGMQLYQTPHFGCTLENKPGLFKDDLVSMYRWHVKDPVYFRKTFKAAMQQIGCKKGSGYFERSDDWSSAAFWYQFKPISKMPPLPDRSARSAGIMPKPKKK
ncbi:MAG: glycoside hydrolase family 172 protein [Planctomycetota bacterium]|jgi:hypothetical protein